MAFVRLPSDWIPLRDTSTDLLDAWRSDERHLYAIVDLAGSTDAAYWHARLEGDDKARNLFQNQPESSATLQAPWLLQITTDHAPRIGLNRTLDEGLMTRNVSWISSRLAVDALAKRLSRRLTARLPEGEVLFRYYDTRLLAGWWAVLSDEERSVFGAIGTRWGTLDADGVLQVIELAGEPDTDPFQPPWRISSAQQHALVSLSECQQLVDLLGKRRPDVFQLMDRGAQWRFVSTQQARAKTRHVSRLADQLKYCELALEHGEAFADEARWQPVWKVMETDDLRLKDALDRLLPDATDLQA